MPVRTADIRTDTGTTTEQTRRLGKDHGQHGHAIHVIGDGFHALDLRVPSPSGARGGLFSHRGGRFVVGMRWDRIRYTIYNIRAVTCEFWKVCQTSLVEPCGPPPPRPPHLESLQQVKVFKEAVHIGSGGSV